MALATKDDVKIFLKIPANDTDKDASITALIPAVQSTIEEYCNRAFDKGTVTEYHHGGQDRLFLKRYPIIIAPQTPLTVYEDGNRVFGENSLVDSDDYYVDVEDGIIYFDYMLEKTYGGIKVHYTGGYETIPGAIKQACVEIVVRKLKTGSTGDVGVASKGTPGGINVTFNLEELLPEDKLVLDLFRRELSE